MARSSSSRDISFETDFGSARIRWDGPRATLFLDGVESSAVDTSDPTYLEFEYMQHMSAVVAASRGEGDRFRALHVGGAACALACAWSARYPQSRHVAVEVDGALAAQVREHFPIPKAPQVKIRVGDGRAVLDATREGSFDVIVRDAFAAGVTPGHLRPPGAPRSRPLGRLSGQLRARGRGQRPPGRGGAAGGLSLRGFHSGSEGGAKWAPRQRGGRGLR